MPEAIWRCGSHSLDLSRPLVMGVVNVTPDSFSDGGEYFDTSVAFAHAAAMIGEGAAIVDVGGESTRPGAAVVAQEEEIARVTPVIEPLASQGACVSADTRHPHVARECLASGASILNDISGFRDRAMIDVAAASQVGVVVMHMQGEPATMQEAPHYDDVVAEVRDWLRDRARALEETGVARDRIALDPGIGFGKTLDHNVELLRHLRDIVSLGYPVVVGVSRKRFIGMLTGVEVPAERLPGSLAAATMAVANGASIIRAHDVASTVQALAVASALVPQG